MKGLIYGIALSMVFALTACSEAQFKDISEASQKAEISDEGDQGEEGAQGEEPVAVGEVPDDQLDDYIDHHQCDEIKKRSCKDHDSQNKEQAGDKKALVCHVTAAGAHEICISKNALKAHIGKHSHNGATDYFGACE